MNKVVNPREIEPRNAIIEDVRITIERGILLSCYVYLNYGDGGHQGFGGYTLYLDKVCDNHELESLAGNFLWNIMKVADVECLKDMKGKTVRVKADWDKVYGIGHIVKDLWFFPSEEWAELLAENERKKAEKGGRNA